MNDEARRQFGVAVRLLANVHLDETIDYSPEIKRFLLLVYGEWRAQVVEPETFDEWVTLVTGGDNATVEMQELPS